MLAFFYCLSHFKMNTNATNKILLIVFINFIVTNYPTPLGFYL